MNSNTLTWHLGWTIFDVIVLTTLIGQWAHHDPLFGSAMISAFAIGFMAYRTWYHAVSAWRLR